MIRIRTLAISVSGLMLVATSLHAQDLSRYRDYTLGSSLAAVATTSGVALDAVKLVHQRPAVIQELRWRPERYGRTAAQGDPVREVVFSFYNDQLFLIVVDYDRQRTEGLTDADLIESMAPIYGPPVLTATSLGTDAPRADPQGDVVAEWSDTQSSLKLIRVTYPTGLRLVVVQTPLQVLAHTASADSVRMDRQEAPQRELDRLAQASEGRRVAGDKARLVNKPAFKP
jgi:hypothetical protein